MPVMLGERVSRRSAPDVARAPALILVSDIAIAQAAKMGSGLGAGQIEPGPDGAPVFSHTSFTKNGVFYSSNGERTSNDNKRQGILVAQAVSAAPIAPESAEARIAERLHLEPFSIREASTGEGLAVAELDRNASVPLGDFVGTTHLLDRGAILVASPAPEPARQDMSPIPRIDDRSTRSTSDKNDGKREGREQNKYKLTTLDALIAHADEYMREMNAGRKGRSTHGVTQRQAIAHVLESLSTPAPIQDIELNRRRVAEVPPNVDPEALYHELANQSTRVHSEVTGVTYSSPDTIHGIDQWIQRHLDTGNNRYATYYEGLKRIAHNRWRAQEKKQTEEARVSAPAEKQLTVWSADKHVRDLGDGLLAIGDAHSSVLHFRQRAGYRNPYLFDPPRQFPSSSLPTKK